MAEVIQFQCPVCGTSLRLPLAMAARQGPCPTCGREIIAPDPYRGVGAHEVPPIWHPAELEPTRPFVDSPPLASYAPPLPSEPFQQSIPVLHNPPVWSPPAARPLPVEEPAPALAPAPVPASIPTPAPVAESTWENPPALDPPPPVAATSCQKPQRTILVLSCLLAGLGGFVIGLAWAQRSSVSEHQAGPLVPPEPPAEKASIAPESAKVEKAETPAPKPEPEPSKIEPVATEPPPPAPVLVKPKPETPDPAPKLPEPATEKSAKVSAAAQASLQAFLEAPDWATRSAHVLFPEKIRGAMEAYSREAPDGPTSYKSITVKQSQIDEKTGLTLFVFVVLTEKFPQGIPVAVKETATGWLVDWLTFVEFRDGLFQKFVDGPMDQTGYFHLAVTRPPADRAASTENEFFSSFLIQSPLAEKPKLAFAKKSSDGYKEILAQTAAGQVFAPVLEVRKRKTPEGQAYFEILRVMAPDWLPREQN